MAATTSSIRLPDSLIEAARRDAEVFHRTISGQVEHWAKLGQAFEAAPGFGMERIRAALEGKFSAADLEPDELAIYEDLMGEALARPSAKSVAFFERLEAEGGGVGYDEDDRLVRGLPGGGTEVIDE